MMSRWIPLGIYVAFVAGAMPLSVWIGCVVLKTDIRHNGDVGPTIKNIWREAGWVWGSFAALADCLKGALPIGIAHHWTGFAGWPLAAISLATLVGHALSPFLRFHGGKVLAVTFGVWTGLTLWLGPLLLALFIGVWLAVVDSEGWAVTLGMISVWLCLIVLRPDPVVMTVWAGNLLILVWQYRADFKKAPELRDWIKHWRSNNKD